MKTLRIALLIAFAAAPAPAQSAPAPLSPAATATAAATAASLAGTRLIPADHPHIQYFGRWDFTDPLAPAHGWPGVYIRADFEGTSLGLRMTDDAYYWNLFIDGELVTIFHGMKSGTASYSVVEGLPDGQHSLLLTKRNEYWWSRFTFNGLLLDEGKELLPPPAKPARRIEFIGDSFTSASGNEYAYTDTPPDPAPYTNIHEGFGPITARHFNAQYHMCSISGYGMAVDYKGDATGTIPALFDRTVVYSSGYPWNFSSWQPDLVVICLGLNDYSGLGGYSGGVSAENQVLFKNRYHEFVARLSGLYPAATILAFAPHVELLQELTAAVVREAQAAGNGRIHYADFPYFNTGYVNGGHPNVATHYQIAGRLIAAIDSLRIWQDEADATPPRFTALPAAEPFTLYSPLFKLTVETGSYATVRWSTQAQSWAEMEHTFATTGRRLHRTDIPVEHGRSYTLYLSAIDQAGNAMSSPAVLHFTVDTTRAVRNWREPEYDDSGWPVGPAPLGSASVSANRTLIAPVDAAYFRRKFTIADLAAIAGMGTLIKGGDGAIVYLNGEEIQRPNMPAGAEPAYNLPAARPMTMNEMVVINASNGLLGKLRDGENILAVEVHRSSAASWISFDSQLVDNLNRFYYKLGAEWRYWDKGAAPEEKVQEKTSGVRTDPQPPGSFLLEQNYPNPFNPSTLVRYHLAAPAQVRLEVYDLAGRRVAVLAEGLEQAGVHQATFAPADSGLAGGCYFCRLVLSGPEGLRSTRTRKMLYLR